MARFTPDTVPGARLDVNRGGLLARRQGSSLGPAEAETGKPLRLRGFPRVRSVVTRTEAGYATLLRL